MPSGDGLIGVSERFPPRAPFTIGEFFLERPRSTNHLHKGGSPFESSPHKMVRDPRRLLLHSEEADNAPVYLSSGLEIIIVPFQPNADAENVKKKMPLRPTSRPRRERFALTGLGGGRRRGACESSSTCRPCLRFDQTVCWKPSLRLGQPGRRSPYTLGERSR